VLENDGKYTNGKMSARWEEEEEDGMK